MSIYYFDLRDGNSLAIDEVGLELRDTRSAQAEAARALAGLAWDAMRVDGVQGQQMIIEVRDANGPVMSKVLVRDRPKVVGGFCQPHR